MYHVFCFWHFCVDVDECIEDVPCQHGGICINTDGNYTCDCTATGYGGRNCTEGEFFNNI